MGVELILSKRCFNFSGIVKRHHRWWQKSQNWRAGTSEATIPKTDRKGSLMFALYLSGKI